MEYLYILLGLFVVVLASLIYLREKNRIIWKKLWEIDETINDLRKIEVEVQKKLITADVEDVRLKKLLPSQHGEDVFLWDYFGKKRKGFYVEIGSYDGVTFSNTYWLEAVGWTGILVEPNPKLVEISKKERPYSKIINAAIGRDDGKKTIILNVPIGTGGIDTLAFTKETDYQRHRVEVTESAIKKIEIPKITARELLGDINEKVDVLSIDVEGAELDVLFDYDWECRRPEIIIIEDNSNGKDLAISEFLSEVGYVNIRRIGCNIVFRDSQ